MDGRVEEGMSRLGGEAMISMHRLYDEEKQALGDGT